MKPSRIYTTFEQNGLQGGEVRDLHRITRNEQGDYLFHLDGGEVWQYTELKQESRVSEPTVENVMQIGSGVRDGKPLPFMCFLVLKNKEFSTGNLRKFSPKADAATKEEAESKKGGRPPRDWEADGKILQRWNDARAVAGVTYEGFLKENPDIFRGKATAKRVKELKRLINAASKRR